MTFPRLRVASSNAVHAQQGLQTNFAMLVYIWPLEAFGFNDVAL